MSKRSTIALAVALLVGFSWATTMRGQSTQTSEPSSDNSKTPPAQVPSLTVRSNLVLVPVLVKTKAGENVFSLTADDFILTDNNVAQSLRLETDMDLQ
ncbi:MAG TPA: hypothetical protein VFU48_08200, partial [Nitrospira sp.]|nr:hypothetical protein [Nitrospira sp.]